ncbi:hypothetical protein GOBAR_AA24571 [Gossypium barbadense]|uniref:F-box domain-containing protein n=1 Tax=Gossypium barbadense TaxID=3634 RepID=A0A2P5WYH9_GOSBA|nr:hypothetical protein GOBAR_AA24571 [Gossypium barbadense]
MASYDFSDEILFEIFSRAELKTMKKCRVLSKEWKDLTYQSSFMRLHSERTSTMVGYLVQRSRIFDPLPPELVSIVRPNLLGFLSKFGGNSFYICKPTTQQWEVIPSPKPQFWKTNISMLVLGSNPLRFKIVRLSDSRYDDIGHVSDHSESEYSDEEDVSWHCEIFDSKSWEWKQSDDLKLTCHDSFKNTQVVSACGGLHWLMFNHEQDKHTILSFDGDKEEWGMTSLPDSLGGKDHRCQIAHVSYQGKLGLITIAIKLRC